MLFNAAFSVLAVAAHVPFADRAIRARNRIGAPDNSDHEISSLKRSTCARIQDPTKGFVTQNQPRFAGGRPAILSRHDLNISSAHANSDGFNKHAALTLAGL